MLVPLTPNAFVDTCQVARLRAQGAQTVVTTYTGPEFVVALAVAAVAAIINGTPQGTLLELFPTTQGPQWLGGQNVTTLTQLASGVRARIGQATVIVTGRTAEILANELNVLARCAGGPPTPPVFLQSGPFLYTIQNPSGLNFALNGPSTLTRMGGTSGDTVFGTLRVFGNVPAGQSVFFVVDGLPPIPNAGFQCVASARVTVGSDPLPSAGLLINRDGPNSFYVQGGPFILATTLMIDLSFAYTPTS